jgi:hypothetical protein
MDDVSRRTLLAATAAGGIFAAATAAGAQPSESVPQPKRPGEGGSDPGPRSYCADVSLNQWLALTPPELVEAHLKLDAKTMAAFHKEKFPVVPG